MPEEATEIADKNIVAFRRYDKRSRDHLKTLVTPEVLEEHRSKPSGQHSEALMRLLAYFRFASVTDKYALKCDQPFARYRLIALSGVRGVPPRVVDDKVYALCKKIVPYFVAYHKRQKFIRDEVAKLGDGGQTPPGAPLNALDTHGETAPNTDAIDFSDNA